jgi:hypothetical protein
MKFTMLTAASSIKFLVPKEWKDTAIVKGKQSSHMGIKTMSRATSNPGSNEVCAALDGVWQNDYNLLCDTKYNGVTSIDFAKPTKDPRPINVTLGTNLYEVSEQNHVTDQTDAAIVQYDCQGFWYKHSMVCGLGFDHSCRWNEDCLQEGTST